MPVWDGWGCSHEVRIHARSMSATDRMPWERAGAAGGGGSLILQKTSTDITSEMVDRHVHIERADDDTDQH